MKVEFHNLRHEKWFLDAEPSDTIGAIKERNYEERDISRQESQKLIFSGKILKDTDTLESVKYTEGKGFIVCMLSKLRKPTKPPAAAPSASASKVASNAATSASNTSTGTANSGESASAATSSTSADTTQNTEPVDVSSLSGPSALATGSQLNAIIANIVGMGFTRQQVLLAMRRAFNNPDRAVEYLVTGQIPEDAGEASEQNAAEESADAADAEASGNDAGSSSGTKVIAGALGARSEGTSVLNESGEGIKAGSNDGEEDAEMEDNESPAPSGNAREASQAVSERSAATHDSIDRDLFSDAEREMQEQDDSGDYEVDFQELLGLDDEALTELRQAVAENPQSMLKVMDPILRGSPETAEVLLENMEQFMMFLRPNAPQVISEMALPELSEDEDAAVRRLMELGFSMDETVMAYLVCDKDEQLTANYLLENGNDL